ncbi:MAG: cation:proton antiporter [Planctomycetes bacterium]|nr:cation:proton antiporter [Planctomycetota bacterium]
MGKPDALMHVLLALTAVIVCGYVLGRLFRYVGQPPVIGEVIAGIVLGPSLLGRFAPEARQFLLPDSIAPFIGFIAQFGVILYMFLLGLELDTGLFRKRARATVLIASSSILVPFLLGGVLAFYLYPLLSSEAVPFASFGLFLGVAMAVTAFPVLARILSDQGIHQTPLGSLALSCAALNDVLAWCLLALVVGVAQSHLGSGFMVIGGAILFIGVMILIVRPIAQRVVARSDDGDASRGVITLVFVTMLLSAFTAEWIGIHAIFGAFLLGAIIPHDSAIARTFTAKLEDLVTIVFLPAFFAFTGMRTQLGIVETGHEWLLCEVIIVVATVGKIGGTFAAARFTGQSWHDSASLGVLMNTRGLMELIILNIGLDLKIISPKLFAMMVVMALVTTLATTHLLAGVRGQGAGVRKDEQSRKQEKRMDTAKAI